MLYSSHSSPVVNPTVAAGSYFSKSVIFFVKAFIILDRKTWMAVLRVHVKLVLVAPILTNLNLALIHVMKTRSAIISKEGWPVRVIRLEVISLTAVIPTNVMLSLVIVKATCTNTDDEFTCACNSDGYTGDRTKRYRVGTDCYDINECVTNHGG